MLRVRVYTSAFCPYCSRAKRLLDKKGVSYDEIDVTFSPAKRLEAAQKSGQTSVPQIWINGEHIGGSDDLHALDLEGRLDAMLEKAL